VGWRALFKRWPGSTAPVLQLNDPKLVGTSGLGGAILKMQSSIERARIEQQFPTGDKRREVLMMKVVRKWSALRSERAGAVRPAGKVFKWPA
jgi:hypothetical protein